MDTIRAPNYRSVHVGKCRSDHEPIEPRMGSHYPGPSMKIEHPSSSSPTTVSITVAIYSCRHRRTLLHQITSGVASDLIISCQWVVRSNPE